MAVPASHCPRRYCSTRPEQPCFPGYTYTLFPLHVSNRACRSIPTIAGDRVYCKMLAHGAVHGAFAGFTGITVGLVNTHYCYLPSECWGGRL